MSRFQFIVLAVLAAFISKVDAECANACNGHGKCVGYDMCICNRNWQANDCSERVCMHGLAHVDTPKGDLDMSGDVIAPDTKVVIDNSFQFPYGTTEQFPQMEDSDYGELTNSAHYYMECSNKGTCDRDSGVCECFDGYDGAACQRASCPGYPNSCSGHGVCKSAKQLANADNGNVYKLWNKDATMGCECDAGYFGADCSERNCKVGVDPLYLDDSSTVKYSIFDFATLTTAATADFDDGHPEQGPGYWAIRFFDHTGEDWVTSPIVAGATCDQVTAALESLPNEVIPVGSLKCTITSKVAADGADNAAWVGADGQESTYPINYRMSIWDAYIHSEYKGQGDPLSKTTELGNNIYSPLMWQPGSFTTDSGGATAGTGVNGATRATLSGHIYRIKFYGNPGYLHEPEIITHLDGKRNSLQSTVFGGTSEDPTGSFAVITKVWTDGQQGEDKDYFADHCDGVTVRIYTDAATDGTASHENNVNTKVYALIPGSPATFDNANDPDSRDAVQMALLKKCLGDSDHTSTNNVDIYDWDVGSDDYPHLVKLVRTVTSYNDGGYYVAIKYTAGQFKMLNPFIPPDGVLSDTYEVYTTKGTLSRVSRQAQAHFGFAQKMVYTTNTEMHEAHALGNSHLWDGDLSCEVGDNNGFRVAASVYQADVASTVSQEGDGYEPTADKTAALTLDDHITSDSLEVNGNGADVFINDVVTEWTYNYNVQPSTRKATAFYKNCVNKTDIITFINTKNTNFNAPNLNLYTVTRLVKDKNIWSNFYRYGATSVEGLAGSNTHVDTPTRKLSNGDLADYDPGHPLEFGTNVINLDMSTNWGTDIGAGSAADEAVSTTNASPTWVYKFVPAAASTYEYVAECSNRGLCDRDSGSCECFAGYTNDNCDTQSSLAL